MDCKNEIQQLSITGARGTEKPPPF